MPQFKQGDKVAATREIRKHGKVIAKSAARGTVLIVSSTGIDVRFGTTNVTVDESAIRKL